MAILQILILIMIFDTPIFQVQEKREQEQKYMINPFTLRITLERSVCFSHTFENNLAIKREFTKYLKESCYLASD